MSLWVLLVCVACTVNAVSAASTTSPCASVDTCYAGGASSTPCTVSSGGCPPCVTFSDNGCYVLVNGACPFGVDCTSVWSEAPTTSGSSTVSKSPSPEIAPTTTTTTDTTSTKDATTTIPSNTASPSALVDSVPSKSASGPSDTADVPSPSIASSTSGSSGPPIKKTSTGSSDMSVVFAIIGAAIGVIAVAVIFLTLVRRSNAAHDEDEDDVSNTPLGFSKGPVVHASNTTGAASYSSYNNGTPGMGFGNGAEMGPDAAKGVSMNAVSYYNQQPPPSSAAPSPRMAGRAIPSQPVGMNGTTGMARPYGGSQTYGVSGVGVTSGFGTSGFGPSGVGAANQVPPTPAQHLPMGGVAPSPHLRRESYEF